MRGKLVCAALLLVAGCEILEEDISKERALLLAPADGIVIAPGAVDFRWQALPDATGYECTVVSPTFDAAERIVADTVIYTDSLARHYGCRIELPEGRYEWRVTAFNSAYTSRPAVRILNVRHN